MNSGESYIDSHHEKVVKFSQRKPESELFINDYNWEGINYLAEIKECKNFEKLVKHLVCQE